jgi:hypothetical protein
MNVSSVNTGASPALSQAQFAAQWSVGVAKKAQDVTKEMGDATLKLIQSANIDPAVGKNLDITV